MEAINRNFHHAYYYMVREVRMMLDSILDAAIVADGRPVNYPRACLWLHVKRLLYGERLIIAVLAFFEDDLTGCVLRDVEAELEVVGRVRPDSEAARGIVIGVVMEKLSSRIIEYMRVNLIDIVAHDLPTMY